MGGDGIDADCDGTADEGCGWYGSPTAHNGGGFTVTADHEVFIAEFPGSYSSLGTLHRVGPDGVQASAVNTVLPSGTSDVVRAPDGRLFAVGTHTFNTPRIQTVVELDTTTRWVG